MAELDLGENPLADHFNNLEQNVFEGGIAPADVQRHRGIRLHVREGLKQQTIKNFLSAFGNVEKVVIPSNQDQFKNSKEGYMYVFADFSEFAEAEKALRELDIEKSKDIVRMASFAFPKRKNLVEPIATAKEALEMAGEPPSVQPQPDNFDVVERREFDIEPPIIVDYSRTEFEQDNIERVTEFHRKKKPWTYQQSKYLEWLIKKTEANEMFEGSLVYNNSLLESITTPLCSRCERQSLLQCDKTRLYFCSISCSRMLEEAEVALDVNEILFDEPIEAGDRVTITGIINEKCIYVRRHDADFGLLLNQILETSKGASKLNEYPVVGDLVLVRSLGEVCRSEVISISSADAITVRLIDYGNTECVSLSDLMAMEPACQALKCFTHKVYLKDVVVEAINESIIQFLDNLLQNKAELLVKESDLLDLVLIDVATNQNVNSEIVTSSEVPDATYDVPGELYDWDERFPVKLGRNRKFYVANLKPDKSSPELIAIIAESEMKDFRELYRAINVYGSKYKSGEFGLPKDDMEIFLAYCNNQWHRAIVVTREGDCFPWCLLIDLQNLQKINLKNMIPMPRLFATPPPVVRLCKVEYGNDDAKERANETIRENEMFVAHQISQDSEDSEALIIRMN